LLDELGDVLRLEVERDDEVRGTITGRELCVDEVERVLLDDEFDVDEDPRDVVALSRTL